MSKKQATLFQSWGTKAKGTVDKPAQHCPQPSTSSASDEVIDLCGSFEDGDDDILCEAEESAANESKSIGETFKNKDDFREVDGNEVLETHLGDISIGAEGFTPTQVQTQSSICPGFDKYAGKLWIYPTNYPVREYQFNIVQQALFKNTMVTLPTGLGKTFIAAVVMYNFYRWYPQGKVIFMAPTKPLVAQQIEACYNIMGIPQDHTAEMTGSMGPSKREKAWHEKRVFFLTPQVLTNDLSRGSCPAHDVKCLVIDEAHKALGNHAYCQVVRELVKYTENFRILALSATPGSDIKAVQQVLNNLLISQIEIRTEESADIKRYSHERKVEKIVVPLGDELTKVKTRYVSVMEVVVSRLKRCGVLYNKDTTSLSKFLILKAREAFRQNPPERLQRNQYGIVEGDFALAMSLYHGYELLQLHGSRSLYNFLDGILTGDKGYGRTRTELTKNADFNELMGLLSGKYTKPEGETASQAGSKPFVIGHPKMEKLQEIVLDHFNTHRNATTRVMIFSQYRDSVQEITDMLHVHRPVVKVMSFIGQATAGKSTKGFTQKEQLKVMKQFREGGYNTLVSTCVGEEGLDIGDVDLIICFDAHKSPIRLVQRMGRTGRKREGRIVMLVTQGKEEQIYNQSQYSKRSIHKAILNGAKSLHFYQHSPRMLPENYTPTCHKMHITVKENFKPTKKITSDKDLNQSKITSLMSDAASKKTHTEEVITLAEYRELEPWLVPEEDIPKLPTCRTVCLETDKTDENQMEKGNFLSLSEWSPWQNTLQDTVFVDHSMASRHLVQLMEFVQLQQSLDSKEDAYGLEMAAYLNEEDILQPGETDAPSIVKFCVPKQNKNKEDNIRNRQNSFKGGKAKSRRSDSLPKFDFLNNDPINSSDDDLPAFNVELEIGKSTSFRDRQDLTTKDKSYSKDEENETVSEIHAMKDKVCLRKDVNETMEISDDEGILNPKLSDTKEDTLSTFTVERRKKLFESKAKSLEKKMSVEKTRKRKKSRQISEKTSVIKLIADSDSNDFDGVPEVSVNINEEQELEDIHKYAEQRTAVFSSKEVSKYSPDHSISETEMINEVKNDTSGGCFRIKSPPPIEHIENLIEAVEREIDFKTFDIFAALDEWHLENKDGKYIVYPETMKKSFLHHPDKVKSTLKKKSDVVTDMKLTGILLHDKTDKSTKSSTSGTSVEIDLCKEKYPEKVKLTNDKDSVDSLGSANRNSNLNMLKDSNHEINNQKTILFISPDKTSVALKTEVSKENKSNESLTVCDYTKTIEQEENDDFACTGNFILNADDVLFTNDDWLDEEMEECSMHSKQKLQAVLENDKTTPKYFNNSFQCCKKNQCIKDKDREGHVCLCKSDSILLNKVDKVDNSDTKETKHSFINNFPKERLNSSTESVINGQLSMPFSTEKETNCDSSFASVKDDDIFMDMKTPANNTQITFTQALNFVHSGTRISGSESCSESSFKDSDVHPSKDKSMKKTSPNLILESSVKANNKLGIEFSEECELSSNMGGDLVSAELSENKSEPKKEKTEKLTTDRRNSRQSSTSEEGVEMPEFDLGFDFDEDIIPPSPESMQISQKPSSSCLSQTFMFTHRLGQNTFASDDLAPENKDQIVDESVDNKRKDQKTNANSITQVLKSKKSWNLQNQQNAAFVKPFQDKDEESQSLIDDQVIHSVKHKQRILGSLHFLGKADLEPILENDLKGTKSATKKISRSDKEIKNDNQNEVVENEKEQAIYDEFEASFALLGEDLEDWIDSGVEANVKTNQKPETFLQKEILKERKSILASQDRLNTPVATVNPMNLSHDLLDKPYRNQDSNTSNAGTGKLVRKSIFMLDDLPSDSFDDSINFANDLVLDINISKNNECAIVQSHNTSTPVSTNKKMHIVTPCIGIETTPRKANTKAGKEKETTRRTSCNSSFEKANFSPVSGTEHGNNQDYHEVESVAENDDSFIVRRKKKVQILDSPLSQENVSDLVGGQKHHLENKIDSNLVFSCTKKKTIQMSSSGSDDDFDDSFLLKKYRVKKSDPPVINYSSDDDFEEAVLQSNNQIPWKNATKKPEICISNTEHSKVTKKVRSKCGVIRKRTSNPFIEEEAELSEEDENAASSDEHEGSDQDAYEGSFISDSQVAESQALNQTDIHALYLKSVKSPQMQRGGFKLQFNQREDVDVYSQRPPPEDSHYMEDSFCVGSEEEEEEDAWLMRECNSEKESREITLMQNSLVSTGRKRRRGLQAFQTSRQREIQIGRMKALSEIRSKLAGKAANRDQQKQNINQACEKVQKHKPGKRNRIQMQGDSSTDDENSFQCNMSDLMSPKLQPALNCNKRRRRVLSSDDSENEEFIESRSMCKINTNIQSTNRNEGERGRNVMIASISSTSGKLNAEEIRQERLKKQREKQAEFKRLLEKRETTDQIGHSDEDSTCTTSGLTKIKEKSEGKDTFQRNKFEFVKPTIEDKSETDLLLSSSVRKSKFSEKPKILVDSKEISGSQDIISDLRFKHDIIVSAAQLPGCDYIVSNRMAIERKQWSEFSNGANRSKLIERMQHLGELYDRPCLIVEKDRVKPGEEKSTRPVHWTKYVDRTLALLLRSEIKVMFTDNYTETASVLADLCRLEQRKNMMINVPVDLNDEQLHRIKFFLSIPKLSYIHALNLCDGFRSVTEFIKSSIILLERLGKMSRNRATEVYNYLRRTFDPNMLPSSYK